MESVNGKCLTGAKAEGILGVDTRDCFHAFLFFHPPKFLNKGMAMAEINQILPRQQCLSFAFGRQTRKTNGTKDLKR